MYLIIEYCNDAIHEEPFLITFHGLFEILEKAKNKVDELASKKNKISKKLTIDMLKYNNTKCLYTVITKGDEKDEWVTTVYRILEMKTS